MKSKGGWYKVITAGLAALTLIGGSLAAVVPAQADPWRGGWRGRGYGYGYGSGPALFAGLAGLAIGLSLADGARSYGPPRPYFDYRRPYPYATCYARRTVWDPYIRRYAVLTEPYAC